MLNISGCISYVDISHYILPKLLYIYDKQTKSQYQLILDYRICESRTPTNQCAQSIKKENVGKFYS